MNKLKRMLTTALAVLFAAGLMFAFSGTLTPVSADDGYTYTVKIYSGNEGYFDGDESKHVKTIKGLSFGEEYTIRISDLDLTLVHPGKFYARGVKVAGHDNDESVKIYQSGSFKATSDKSYSIAYGMKGGMVKYTVRYVDTYGNEVHSAETFYGMAGDKPVVSYQYVEGYLPQAYNLGKTLSADEAKNVFTFVYDRAGAVAGNAEDADDEDADTDDDSDNNNNNGTAGGARNANADGSVGGQTGEPDEYRDLDDDETPLAGGDDVDGSDKSGESEGLSLAAKIGIGAAIAAIIAAIAALIIRRRNSEYDDDDYEDEGEESKE